MFVFIFIAMDGAVTVFQEKTIKKLNKRLLKYFIKEDRDFANQLDNGGCWELHWADSNGLNTVASIGLCNLPQFVVD